MPTCRGPTGPRASPREIVERSLHGSLAFGLFHGGTQVGLARVVTDRATFAYLCDVYVLEEHQGRGLGRWLIETVMAHPDLQGLRRFSLVTQRRARLVQRTFGFQRSGVTRRPHGDRAPRALLSGDHSRLRARRAAGHSQPRARGHRASPSPLSFCPIA